MEILETTSLEINLSDLHRDYRTDHKDTKDNFNIFQPIISIMSTKYIEILVTSST
jgi:hypothetical protein